MKLIVDTNIILKALIKNSRVRAILLNPNHQFYVPEHAIKEIERHLSLIVKKSGLSGGEVKLVLSTLLTNMQVIPPEDVLGKWGEATDFMAPIDKEDIPFMAAAWNSRILCQKRSK